MRRRLAYLLVPLALLGASAGLVAGCQQKDGERCEINEDCESGLCNEGRGVCQAKGATNVDAIPAVDASRDGGPVDARPIDAQVIDAIMVDAN